MRAATVTYLQESFTVTGCTWYCNLNCIGCTWYCNLNCIGCTWYCNLNCIGRTWYCNLKCIFMATRLGILHWKVRETSQKKNTKHTNQMPPKKKTRHQEKGSIQKYKDNIKQHVTPLWRYIKYTLVRVMKKLLSSNMKCYALRKENRKEFKH